MLENYFPILVFTLLGIIFGIAPIAAGAILSPHRPNPEKLSQYECGFAPFEDARLKFDVRFYLVAILFIVFDLEVAFLFPWAVNLHQLGWPAVMAMGIFLLLLLVGFIYEWKKGALEWE